MNTKWIGSPNFTSGRQGKRVNRIVIHWMAGSLSSTDAVFQNTARQTSAHYGIENDQVHQYVKDEDTAYHAGNWNVNTESIGIEHSAQPGRNATDVTYESSAQLIADLAHKFSLTINNSTIIPHNAIVATQCPGTIDLNRIIKRANELIGKPVPSPAPAPKPQQSVQTVEVAVDTLYVRSAPNTGAAFAGSKELKKGDTFKIVGYTQGQNVSGVSTWAISEFGNYVWAGGLKGQTTPPAKNTSGVVEIQADTLNARSGPSTGYPVRASFKRGTAKFINAVNGESVTGNGKTSNVWLQSEAGNWFSSVWTSY